MRETPDFYKNMFLYPEHKNTNESCQVPSISLESVLPYNRAPVYPELAHCHKAKGTGLGIRQPDLKLPVVL